MKRLKAKLTALWAIIRSDNYLIITQDRKGFMYKHDMSIYDACNAMDFFGDVIVGGEETLQEAKKGGAKVKTLLEELREWCQQNCFNIEGQAGDHHIVLDQWELDTKIGQLIEKENEKDKFLNNKL